MGEGAIATLGWTKQFLEVPFKVLLDFTGGNGRLHHLTHADTFCKAEGVLRDGDVGRLA